LVPPPGSRNSEEEERKGALKRLKSKHGTKVLNILFFLKVQT
jgi:hypothetical protein